MVMDAYVYSRMMSNVRRSLVNFDLVLSVEDLIELDVPLIQ